MMFKIDNTSKCFKNQTKRKRFPLRRVTPTPVLSTCTPFLLVPVKCYFMKIQVWITKFLPLFNKRWDTIHIIPHLIVFTLQYNLEISLLGYSKFFLYCSCTAFHHVDIAQFTQAIVGYLCCICLIFHTWTYDPFVVCPDM